MTAATLDATFDALASEPRRAIVEQLGEGSLTTPELGRQFDFSKQALNRHVAVLERAGLVRRVPRGRVHELHLVSDPLVEVVDWIQVRRAGWEANLDRLDDLLGGQQ